MHSDALNKLGMRLRIPGLDQEDWDLIFADSTRVGEFCDLYESGVLSVEEQQLLMQLTVASLDHLLTPEPETPLRLRVEMLLQKHRDLHEKVITYWAHQNKAIVWNVTPMMRRLRDAP